jgi:predicted acylesterase/phospholipase RssA
MNNNNNEITELVLGGSAHRGISYLGALQRLQELGIINRTKLKRIIGVSMGSLIGLIYMNKNMSINQLLDLFLGLSKTVHDFIAEGLRGPSPGPDPEGSGGHFSIFNGPVLERLLSYFMTNVYGSVSVTFLDLFKLTDIEFTVSVVNYEQGLEYINYKNQPDTLVIDVVRASMSLPYIFKPVHINGQYYIDGGVIENLPMHLVGPSGIGIQTDRNVQQTDIFDTIYILVQRHIRKLRNNEHENRQVVFSIPVKNEFIRLDLNKNDLICLYKNGYNYIDSHQKIYHLLFNGVLRELLKSSDTESTESSEFIDPPVQESELVQE